MSQRYLAIATSITLLLAPCVTGAAEPETRGAPAGTQVVLVERGQANAEIVIAERRPRMVTLAALELQHYLGKISGARLPIVTAPSSEKRVRIHIGRSQATDRLGVNAEGLRHGAYRITFGADWIVLIGHDEDFDLTRYPLPMKRNDIPRAEAEWLKAIEGKTETSWGFPFRSGFKNHWNPNDFQAQMTARYGHDFSTLWTKKAGHSPGFWNTDLGGSLNATYGLLRRLGVRWYMPGELGEVVPKRETVAIAARSETVKPDFPLRDWNWYNFASFSYDDVIWARRLGMGTSDELLGPCNGPHGMVPVHSTPAMQKAHPDYYALISGTRDIFHRERGTPCFTSKGLQRETVNYVRFLYDRYDLPSVDIWPVDGLRVCQCETCKRKSASELVWGFTDAVAREVYKTHPKKRITAGAYTSYSEPPDTIQKFSPNLAVWISNAGRPKMEDAEHWKEYLAKIDRWTSRLAPGSILRLENNRYHIWGEDEPIAYPVLHPRGVARDLAMLRGISLGDTGEQSQVGGRWRAPALEHITLHVQASFLWNATQDIDKVLEEYCTNFYGPAAKAMFEAIAFAEHNLAYRDQSRRGKGSPANVTLAVNLRFRDMLDAARKTAGNTVYGKRIAAIISELQPREQVIAKHREKEESLAKARAMAPAAVGTEKGSLDNAVVYTLKDNMTGKAASVPTTFRVGWEKNALLFDIVCSEPEMAKLKGSSDVHNSDHIAISLETPMHSYYQIAISPDGKLAEGNPASNWKSLAEVKAEQTKDSWRLKVRIPVVGAVEAESDPKHRVAGQKPTDDAPWHFNVGRYRLLDMNKAELQAFSPTRAGWHHPEKFGKLTIK